MGDYDFVVNPAALDNYIQALSNFEEQLSTNIGMIYYGVDEMHGGWAGDSYNQFKEEVTNFKDPLTELCVFINAYRTVLSNQVTRVETVVKKVNTEFERMA